MERGLRLGSTWPLACWPVNRIMRVKNREKVLEKLATTEKSTIVIERQPDGKIRVTSGSWDGEKVFLRHQVLEVRSVDNRFRVARKEPAGRMGPTL
jgi:hypothetical protein